jgi:tRNA G18 (ribose-2'-O)-methylase SpoU
MRKLILQDLHRLDTESFKKADKKPLILICDNIRSMHNVGSFFRSGDAFAIKEIHLVGITACPPHREIQKTALGSTETVEWKYFKDVESSIKYCIESNIKLLPFEQTTHSKSIYDLEIVPDFTYGLVIGNEVSGVSMDYISIADQIIEIPQYGTKHSLNVSVAASIGMFYISGKMNK